ncbi:hypothetical protein HN588_03410 [Candidatus Bathyarchaeota archaeon]|jgi:hypothetical protein|nr:hypothetical protein [Candidatus Bathyarchaeota archaeon]
MTASELREGDIVSSDHSFGTWEALILSSEPSPVRPPDGVLGLIEVSWLRLDLDEGPGRGTYDPSLTIEHMRIDRVHRKGKFIYCSKGTC